MNTVDMCLKRFYLFSGRLNSVSVPVSSVSLSALTRLNFFLCFHKDGGRGGRKKEQKKMS